MADRWLTEIRRSLAASVLLFRGRPEGLTLLDRSLEGFWRSFAAILLVLPINYVGSLAQSRIDESDAPAMAIFLGDLPLVMIDWVAFPIILALAARPLGVGGTYVSYIVARNWAMPLSAGIMVVPVLLHGAGWTDRALLTLLSIVALAVVLRYHFMIVRAALRTPVALSLGIVVADMMVSLFILALFRSALG